MSAILLKRLVTIALLLLLEQYILFFDFNGFSTNPEDWIYGPEALRMKLEGIF